MTTDTPSPYLIAHFRGERPSAPDWFEAALGHEPERSVFTSDGADIELLTWGAVGKPGLLFLHGNGAHADWWSMIAPFFAADWRCAAISWSGMGRSGWRADGYTVDTFAQEAKDAIVAAKLDIAGPPIVIGHSMGGLVGVTATADNPDIGGLMLVDTPLGLSDKKLEGIRDGVPKAANERRPFASLADGLARFRFSPPQSCANDYIVDHIARGALVEDDGQWFWRFDPRRVGMRKDPQDLPIGRVACPMAYLYGDRSALVDAESLAITLPKFPAGTPIVEIPDAAHHVLLDQPLALVAALRALLARWPS